MADQPYIPPMPQIGAPPQTQPGPQPPPGAAPPGSLDLNQIFQGMPPDQKAKVLKQILGLSTLGDQSAVEQGNLAAARALEGHVMRPQPRHTTGLGAGLAAGADILDAYRSKRDQDAAKAAQKDIIGKQGEGREAFAGLFAL